MAVSKKHNKKTLSNKTEFDKWKEQYGTDVDNENSDDEIPQLSFVKSGGTVKGVYRKATGKDSDKEKTNWQIAPSTKNGYSVFAAKKKHQGFDDGYQFGDISRTMAATGEDFITSMGEGLLGIGEGLLDTAAYAAAGVADISGYDDYAKILRGVAQQNFVQQAGTTERRSADFSGNKIDEASVLGEKGRAFGQGLGQIMGILSVGGLGKAAGLGSKAVTALTTAVNGLSATGSGMSEAYSEGATDEEAAAYGVVSGIVNAGSELLFGGLGKAVNAVGIGRGISSLDDIFAKKLSEKISNRFVKTVVQYGIKASAEGFEEVLAGIGEAVGKKFTYMDDESIRKLLKDEKLLEQFVMGAVLSGVAQLPDVSASIKNKTDFITGESMDDIKNAQNVVNTLAEEQIAADEKDGKKLTAKRKAEIKKDIEQALERGELNTEDIERIVGGDDYTKYKAELERQEKLQKEEKEILDSLRSPDNKLVVTKDSIEKQKRLEELRAMKTDKGMVDALKARLDERVGKATSSGRLAESFENRARRGQAFQADLSKYKGKALETVKKAVESGVLNDTRRTHELVDLAAKIAEDKGINIDFTNNKKLAESGFGINGKQVNGFINANGITLNANSAKALNKVVGHEITHAFEGTELYESLRNTVTEFSKVKGEYDSRLKELTEIYKGVKDADVQKELVADLVGDYIFADEAFVRNLHAGDRNLFQKIFDEVKYLCKIATAGSEQARQLEEVKRVFEKVYREGVADTKGDSLGDRWEEVYDAIRKLEPTLQGKRATKTFVKTGTKYSLSDSDGKQLSKEQQEYFKDSKVRDENGNLLVCYHGTDADFNAFDADYISRDNKLGAGFYFKAGEGLRYSYDHTKKVYLNITNPITDSSRKLTKEAKIEFCEKTGIEYEYDADEYDLDFYERASYSFEGNTRDFLNNVVNILGIDGVISEERKTAVAFMPNQIKNIDNAKPTANPDIRFSLSPETSQGVDRIALENIAPTREQIAVAKRVTEPTKKVDTLPMREDIAPVTKSNAVGSNIAPATVAGKRRSFATTATESNAVRDKVMIEDLSQESTHYVPVTNAVTLSNADDKLVRLGYDKAVKHVNTQINSKKISLEDIALGERLIQEAVRKGDTKTAAELIQNVAILGTELGQKVQALSIIKRLTPEGQVQMLGKIVERGKARGDKAFEGVELTQEMKDEILKTYREDGSYDQDALNKAVEDVKQRLADQMKITTMERLNAWRYLAMLGNPKTHIRNVVSNVAMMGTTAVKNAVAKSIEPFYNKGSRTKTWKTATQTVRTFADNMAMEEKDNITGDGKYSESASIKDKRNLFRFSVLNKAYDFNNDSLAKEDWWFSKVAYKNSLMDFLTANDIRTADDIKNNPETVEKGKQYALEQAQIATFRQYSWIASKIGDIERKNVATEIAVGAVLPFKKTPVNIAKTALNYSPLGFTKTLTYDMAQVKSGKMEASTLVDHLSQNLTGSSLVLLGYMLAKMGFLNGAGDDDKEGKYDYQLGKQAYSINIGDATYTLSWLSPTAMPLFVGANAFEILEEKQEWNGDVIMQTLAQTLDPLSEMSFLSSLDDVLSSYESGVAKFAGIATSAAQSYVSQYIPTLVSQVAAVTDDKKRTTKVASDSDFKLVDETINQLFYKIPGLRQTLEPTIDIWGNPVYQNNDAVGRAVETFLAPWAEKELIATEIDTELKTLYEKSGDDQVIPSVPSNTFMLEKVKYEMSEEEYTEYKRVYGRTAYILLERLFATSDYRNASAKKKAAMVKKVYDIAKDDAKENFLEGRED